MKKRVCAYCGEEFEAQRRTAKFCCDDHRAAFHYSRRINRPVPAEDDSLTLFRYNHRWALRTLKDASPNAAEVLEKIFADYGAQAAETVLREIIIPLHNAHDAVYDRVFWMTSLGGNTNKEIFHYLEGVPFTTSMSADEPDNRPVIKK